jgi:hypothetical protein
MNTFTRTWELAITAIDYVARHLGVDRPQACAVLKDALQDGRICGHGLIVGVGEIDLDRSFWRLAAINPDGSAINLSQMKRLAWFEIAAEDVLRLWPPRPAPAVPETQPSTEPAGKQAGKRGPRPSVTPRVIEQMKKIDPKELAEMKHEQMATVFDASPDTCVRARVTVLGNLANYYRELPIIDN